MYDIVLCRELHLYGYTCACLRKIMQANNFLNYTVNSILYFLKILLLFIYLVQTQQRDVVLPKNIQRSTILDGDKNHNRILLLPILLLQPFRHGPVQLSHVAISFSNHCLKICMYNQSCTEVHEPLRWLVRWQPVPGTKFYSSGYKLHNHHIWPFWEVQTCTYIDLPGHYC